MRIQMPSAMPLTVETSTASRGTSGLARAITSCTPWLGMAQITSSLPSRASPSSAVARTRSGTGTSVR
jgi:hypothetical protein